MSQPIPSEWLVGHRMYVDKEFQGRLLESGFTSSEWDIIMSVVSFAVEGPHDPEGAHLRPVLDDLPAAVEASEGIPEPLAETDPRAGRGGFLDRVSGILGRAAGGGDSRDDRIEAAETLVGEYTEVLEIHLKQQGLWQELCERAADRSE